MFVPAQGPDALPPTVRDPVPARPSGLAPSRPGSPDREASDAPLGAGESHVRLKAMPASSIDWLDAQEILDEMSEEQLALGVNLSCLEQAVAIAPRTPGALRALEAIAARVERLGALRDALASVQVAAIDRQVQRLFVPDAPLSDFLRGLYAWAHATVRALDELAASLRARSPDWGKFRCRVEDARNFHFDELHGDIRTELGSLGPVPGRDDLIHAVERLFVDASALEASLDARIA
jgi:hypothetical protein